jgi:hypothetical protein
MYGQKFALTEDRSSASFRSTCSKHCALNHMISCADICLKVEVLVRTIKFLFIYQTISMHDGDTKQCASIKLSVKHIRALKGISTAI